MEDREVVCTVKIKSQAMVIEMMGSALITYISCFAFRNQLSPVGVLTAAPYLAQGLVTGFFYLVGKEVSGGHYNPAISFTMALTKHITWMTCCVYIFFQLLGSILGGLMVNYMTPANMRYQLVNTVPQPNTLLNFGECYAIQTFCCTVYSLVYLYVKDHGKEHIHLGTVALIVTMTAIGTCSAGATMGGFNIVAVFGPALAQDVFARTGSWTYYLGPFTGAFLASFIDRYFLNDNSLFSDLPKFKIVFQSGSQDGSEGRNNSESLEGDRKGESPLATPVDKEPEETPS